MFKSLLKAAINTTMAVVEETAKIGMECASIAVEEAGRSAKEIKAHYNSEEMKKHRENIKANLGELTNDYNNSIKPNIVNAYNKSKKALEDYNKKFEER